MTGLKEKGSQTAGTTESPRNIPQEIFAMPSYTNGGACRNENHRHLGDARCDR